MAEIEGARVRQFQSSTRQLHWMAYPLKLTYYTPSISAIFGFTFSNQVLTPDIYGAHWKQHVIDREITKNITCAITWRCDLWTILKALDFFGHFYFRIHSLCNNFASGNNGGLRATKVTVSLGLSKWVIIIFTLLTQGTISTQWRRLLFLKKFTEGNLRNCRKILRNTLFFNGLVAMAKSIKRQVFLRIN